VPTFHRPHSPPDPRGRSEERPPVAVGTVLGNYRLESFLGRGGQAVVFLAEDVVLRRHAAVKVFTDPRVSHELVDEGRLVAKLSHPNIVQVYHLELSAQIRYMAMEYISGGDLVDRVRRVGPLNPRQALERISEVLSGLAHAHDLGVVHRDIKPQNLLGALENTIKIADFGLATVVEGEWEARRVHTVGTPLYMAPEVWEGAAPSPASDLYSLGCVLYFMLVGETPFVGSDRESLRRAHLQTAPGFPTWLATPLSQLVEQLLAKDPAKRLAAAHEAILAVQGCAESLGFVASRSGVLPRVHADRSPTERAERAIIELPPLSQASSRLEHAITSGAALIALTGPQLHYLQRLVQSVVDRRSDEISLAAVVRLDVGDRLELPKLVRNMLRSQLRMAMEQEPGLRPSEDAAIVRALVPEGRRRAFPIIVNRAFHPKEVLFLARLINEAHQGNLSIIVISRDPQSAELARAVEIHGHIAHADFIDVPPMTAEQGLAHLKIWIRAAGIPPSRRWSAPALSLATDLALHHPAETLRILGNAEVLASRLRMPVLTTWCLHGGSRHAGHLGPDSSLLEDWRIPPRRWPDAPELERWTKLPRLESWSRPAAPSSQSRTRDG